MSKKLDILTETVIKGQKLKPKRNRHGFAVLVMALIALVWTVSWLKDGFDKPEFQTQLDAIVVTGIALVVKFGIHAKEMLQ